VSIPELKALARKRWEEWLPEKVKALRAEGKLDEALHGAARGAQKQIDHLMQDSHYQEHEAREVGGPYRKYLDSASPRTWLLSRATRSIRYSKEVIACTERPLCRLHG
jgi:hypothetical protein